MFIQLTQASTGNPVHVNSDNITAIYPTDIEYKKQNEGCGESVVEFVGGDSVQVMEAPNVILNCSPPRITPA